jgi:hypothetical protein
MAARAIRHGSDNGRRSRASTTLRCGERRCAISGRIVSKLAGQHAALLALRKRDVHLHLGKWTRRLRQAGFARQGHQGKSAHPVPRNKIAVEIGKTHHVLRARIAAPGCGQQERHGLLPLAILKQSRLSDVCNLFAAWQATCPNASTTFAKGLKVEGLTLN